MVLQRREFDNIAPCLMSLNWLCVEERILFRLLAKTFKSINEIAPGYLTELVKDYEPKRSLRTKKRQALLIVPKYNMVTNGTRAFIVAAPIEWNRLPEDICTIIELDTFKR